jgi:adhesin transport system outer membrane protein
MKLRLEPNWRSRRFLRDAPYAAMLICAQALCAGPLFAQSLQQVVEASLKSNPRVQAATAQHRAALAEVSQARAAYLPNVDLTLGGGSERVASPQVRAIGASESDLNRRESGVAISQRLFDGFATRSEIERFTARADNAAARLAEIREEVALKTTEAYLEVLKNRRLVRLGNENLRSHLQTQDKIRIRVEGGITQKSDLQQVLGRVALAKSTVSARAGKLREVEANYRRLTGNPPEALQEPTERSAEFVRSGIIDADRLASSVRDASKAAVVLNPSVTAAEAEITAAEAAVRGAKAPYYPRLSLELSSNRNFNIAGLPGLYTSDAAMLMLRWNVFRGGADRAQESALIQRRYAAIDSATSVRRDVEERVALAMSAKATTEERIAYLQEHASLSAEVLQSYQEQLELGRRTLLDLLNADNELFTARSNLAAGRYEDLYNQYAIEAAKGQLVKSLGVSVD